MFIDNKNILKIKVNNNKFVLIKKEVNFPEIYNEIKNYAYNNLDAFNKKFNEKLTQKIKEFIDNKKYINQKIY